MNTTIEKLFHIVVGARDLGSFTEQEMREIAQAIDRALLRQKADVSAILKFVAQSFNISVEAMLRPGRGLEKVSWPRQIAMAAIYQSSDYTLAEVGQIFGKNHTTIIHALQRVEDRASTEPKTASLLALIRQLNHNHGGAA